MNKIFTAAFVTATVLCMSCGGNDTPETDKSIMPAASDSNRTTGANTASPQPANGQLPAGVNTSVPGAATQSAAQTIPASQASKVLPSAGLNPAHGQPGHRCDISVGAPLNSAPATASAPQTVPATQAVTMAAPTSAPASGPVDPTAKLNPAHGQPGHDCAIPVGAPLKKS